jgi:CRP-like cAMP-binding protein
MRDFNPRGLRRVLYLRRFPVFEAADLDELATIAENVVETRIPAGTTIATAGQRLHGVHLIVDGEIESRPRGSRWGPRQVFGALEVLANREISHGAVATTDLVTLQLSSTDIGELLEDNFGVLLATLRELSARLIAAGPLPQRAPHLARAAGPLGLVERLIVLRQQLPFARARLQALASLAHACEEIAWPAGTVIARAGELATSAYVIIDGAALATRGGIARVFESGSALGHLEVLAGVPHTATFETTMPVRALESGAPAILDVIEDHTDVGFAMLATFAGALLDHADARAALPAHADSSPRLN